MVSWFCVNCSSACVEPNSLILFDIDLPNIGGYSHIKLNSQFRCVTPPWPHNLITLRVWDIWQNGQNNWIRGAKLGRYRYSELGFCLSGVPQKKLGFSSGCVKPIPLILFRQAPPHIGLCFNVKFFSKFGCVRIQLTPTRGFSDGSSAACVKPIQPILCGIELPNIGCYAHVKLTSQFRCVTPPWHLLSGSQRVWEIRLNGQKI
jgi:hypothetical protein